MQVVLRHAGIDLYYAGRKHWVGNRDSALDLETIERATELSRDESFGEMDIVVTYDDPTRELVLPLRRERVADAESLSTGAYIPPTVTDDNIGLPLRVDFLASDGPWNQRQIPVPVTIRKLEQVPSSWGQK